jgi:hypothetical protein
MREAIPLDFSSSVQPRRSSCTSSGSMTVLVQASSQRGLGGGRLETAWAAPFLLLLIFAGPSLLFSLEKRPGMIDDELWWWRGEVLNAHAQLLGMLIFSSPRAAR